MGIRFFEMKNVEMNIEFFLNLLQIKNVSAWLLLSDFDNRTFAGNDGYADEINHLYRWDSTVPNHAAICEGDIAVIWDKQKLIGISKIETLTIGLDTKNRYRCTYCSSTKIKKRITKIPEYACGNKPCRKEFDIPVTEEVGVTTYVSEYGQSWLPLIGKLDAKECRKLAEHQKSQHSMRSINKVRLFSFLESLS
jgi:hypothetical protein